MRLARIPLFPPNGHLPNLHARPLARVLHRIGEREPEVLAKEREYVAAHSALEAVIEPLLRRDGEVGIASLMERTRTSPGAAEPAQAHVLTDDLDDIGRLAHAFHRLVGNHCR